MDSPSAPALDPRARARTVGLLLSVAGVAAIFSLQKAFDADLWWHLATGRWVLEAGRVPRQDPFSFATAGAPWVAHSWLADVAMYALERSAGVGALVVAKVAIVAAGFGGAFLLAVRAGARPWLAALSLAAAAPIAQFQFRERPQIAMFVLVPIFYFLLAAPEAERRRWIWGVLLGAMIAWANLHGSFLLGVALAGALTFDRLAALVLRSRAPGEPSSLRGLALAAGLTLALLLVSAVNAYGIALPVQMLRDFTSFAVSRSAQIEEHRALTPGDYPGFIALLIATGATLLAAGRRLRPFDLAAFGGFTWLAVSSVRFAAVAALLYACLLSAYLAQAIDRLRPFVWRGRAPAPWLGPALAAALIAAGVPLAFRATFAPGREAQWGIGVNEGRFPAAAVTFLERAGITGNVFNSWEHGGYLLWRLPGVKDLVDGRALPASFALLEELSRLDAQGLGRWVADHDVRAALLSRNDPSIAFFSAAPDFVQAFFDDRAVVYLRSDIAPASSTTGRPRFLRPESKDPSYLLPIARGPLAAEAERELRDAAAASPDSFTPQFLLGYFLEARGSPEALDHYVAAARASPGLAFGHNGLGARAGAFALQIGRIAELEPFLRDGLKVVRDDPAMETLLATSLQVQRRFADAERTYRQALRHDPGYYVALKNLGFLLMETRRPVEAVPLFRRARAAAPADEVSAYGLAVSLQAAGDRPGATAAWRDLLTLFPSGRWSAEARTRLGGVEPK